MNVSEDDPRPPYMQVTDHLRRAINSGEFKAGMRLPANRELAKQYGVALMTMQRALAVLREEGLLESHHGRGVFVRSPEGQQLESEVPPASEHQEIMQKIDDLQDLVRVTMRDFDARLSQLETAVEQTNQ